MRMKNNPLWSPRKGLLLIVFLCWACSPSACGDEGPSGVSPETPEALPTLFSVEEEGWKDPYQMGSLPPLNKPKGAQKERKILKKSSSSSNLESSSDLRLLRIVKSFLRAFQGFAAFSSSEQESNYVGKLQMKLSKSELQILESFAENTLGSATTRDVEDALLSAFNSAEPVEQCSSSNQTPFSSSPYLPIYSNEDLFIIFLVGLIFCLALGFFTGLLTLGKMLFGFTALCATWRYLYLRKSKQLDKDTPCQEEKPSFFSFYSSSCSKDLKDTLMDSTMEVNPMDALIDTLADVFIRPLPSFGDNLGKFFQSLWSSGGFMSWMFGYGFILLAMVLTIPTFILAFFKFGVPKSPESSSSSKRSPPKKDEDSNERIQVLENQVLSLTSTISTMREVSLQSMEYNVNRKLKEIRDSREMSRHLPLPSMHHPPPVLEDNPPLKKLKGVEYAAYVEESDEEEEEEVKVAEGKPVITTLSSDLILSPPSHFKNQEKRSPGDNKTGDGPKEECRKEISHEEEDDDEDFEVISKNTPPPDTPPIGKREEDKKSQEA
eukprot:TRINITY_DN523_c0_g1_i1.p1 TRINITY_DN523_c0_g1~~TRINITY_DN523_c0_g1_i1.p1  ORF type:complete len:548 (+),score=171.31 TRINITY_DN523_c0_g1_i1:49-1692(+)